MASVLTNSTMPKVWLLDYGAGNVRSLRNALAAIGFDVIDITSPAQIAEAGVLVFPGVGSFGACMEVLAKKGYTDAARGVRRPAFLGICLGLQTLFEGSEESRASRGSGSSGRRCAASAWARRSRCRRSAGAASRRASRRRCSPA